MPFPIFTFSDGKGPPPFVFPDEKPRPKPINTDNFIENTLGEDIQEKDKENILNKLDQILDEDLLDGDIDSKNVTNEEIDNSISPVQIDEEAKEAENISEDSPVKPIKEIDETALELKNELMETTYNEKLQQA